MSRTSYTEWAVLLGDGTLCPVARERDAWELGPEPGYPVYRRTVAVLLRKDGAVYQAGDWTLARRAA